MLLNVFKATSKKTKDVELFITKLKSSTEIDLVSIVYFSQNGSTSQKYIFYLKNETDLHLISFNFSSSTTIKLKEEKENPFFQKIFKNTSTVPYHIKLGELYEFGFESHSIYYQFIQTLKGNDFNEVEPEYNNFYSVLEGLEIKKWTKLNVIEWLGSIYYKNEPLSLIYEDFLKYKNGLELICLGRNNFIKYNPNIEEIALFLNGKKKILAEEQKYSTNKMRFRLKIDSQIKKLDFNTKEFLEEKDEIISTLCDSNEILETYLSLNLNSEIHENVEDYINSDFIEIRLILTEFSFNSKNGTLSNNLNGSIDMIPNHFDFKKSFARFKCGLLIGPWFLEFGDTSICVPKRISKEFRKIFEKIPPIKIIKFEELKSYNDDENIVQSLESKMNLEKCSKILSKIISHWNTNYIYKSDTPNIKNKEGNSYSFIIDILNSFHFDKDFQFNGCLNSFMNEMKIFDESGPSIFPTNNFEEFEKKFKFIGLHDIKSHSFLDNQYLDIFEIDTNFKDNYLHDFIVFQSIDLAFWFRSMKYHKDEFIQCYQDDIPICPFFTRNLFLDIFKKSFEDEFIKEEVIPMNENRKETIILHQSKNESLDNSMTKKKSIFLNKIANVIELQDFTAQRSNIHGSNYSNYYVRNKWNDSKDIYQNLKKYNKSFTKSSSSLKSIEKKQRKRTISKIMNNLKKNEQNIITKNNKNNVGSFDHVSFDSSDRSDSITSIGSNSNSSSNSSIGIRSSKRLDEIKTMKSTLVTRNSSFLQRNVSFLDTPIPLNDQEWNKTDRHIGDISKNRNSSFLNISKNNERKSGSFMISPKDLKNETQRDFIKSLSSKNEEENQLKILNVFEDVNSKNKFEKYCIEFDGYDEFLFYELYHQFLKEESIYEKNLIANLLFDKFINEKGKNSISFNFRDLKKIKLLFQQNPSKSLNFAYQKVYCILNNLNNEFKMIKEKKEIKKNTFPTCFDELILDKDSFNIFSTFVYECFGSNYIECWELLKEYKIEKSKEIKLKLLNYCKLNSNKNLIHDPNIRDKILLKDKTIKGWNDILYSFIYHILSFEYYSRFINSKSWKNYSESHLRKNKNHFKEIYEIQKIEKKFQITQNEIYTVKNLITMESFKGKKEIFENKEFLQKKTRKYLNFIPHENVLRLIELFPEERKSSNILYTITNLTYESFNDFVDKLEQHLDESTLIQFIKQIFSGLNHLHQQQSKIFKVGELTERNIFISSLFESIYLDPGFYYEDESIFPSYFNLPEGNENISKMSDIYSIGLILFRLVTLKSKEEIQEIYNQSEIVSKNNERRKSIGNILNLVPKNEFVQHLKVELSKINSKYLNPKISILIIQMIDSNPKSRPDIESILYQIQKLKRFKSLGSKKVSNRFINMSEIQKYIISNSEYRQYFKAFLRQELSIEALLFFEDVEIFSQLKTSQDRFLKAEEICLSYLEETSELEINVGGRLKRNLAKQIKNAKQSGEIRIDIFDEMAQSVSSMILVDTFSRFQESQIAMELRNYIKTKGTKIGNNLE
eukprot:gene3468-6117_t